MPRRLNPHVGPEAMATWSILSPRSTHWRPASCAEMCAEADDWRQQASFATDDAERQRRLRLADERDCKPCRFGWSTPVVAGSAAELELKALCSGSDGYRRSWSAVLREEGGIVRYAFSPGQPCFLAGQHRLPLERPEWFRRRRGDWRADLGGARRYDKGYQWVEDMQGTLDAWRRAQGIGA